MRRHNRLGLPASRMRTVYSFSQAGIGTLISSNAKQQAFRSADGQAFPARRTNFSQEGRWINRSFHPLGWWQIVWLPAI